MNLLESVLRTCGAEEFMDVFEDEGIGVENLPLLIDEDLIRLGIGDEKIRSAILKHSKTLAIPIETVIDTHVDCAYIAQVLQQQIDHLHLYNASLTFAALQKSIENVDIDVVTGSENLMGVLDDLSCQIDQLREHVRGKDSKLVPVVSRRAIYKPLLLSAVLLITSMIVIKHFTSSSQ